MTGADVIAAAMTWMAEPGTPWLHQASVKHVGTDCIGLIGGVGLELRLPEAIAWSRDPAVKNYSRVPDPRVLIAACRKYLDAVPITEVHLGDILVFRFDKEPQHFAFVSSLVPCRVIHAYAAARKVCENGIDGDWRQGTSWQSLIVSAWRFRGLD